MKSILTSYCILQQKVAMHNQNILNRETKMKTILLKRTLLKELKDKITMLNYYTDSIFLVNALGLLNKFKLKTIYRYSCFIKHTFNLIILNDYTEMYQQHIVHNINKSNLRFSCLCFSDYKIEYKRKIYNEYYYNKELDLVFSLEQILNKDTINIIISYLWCFIYNKNNQLEWEPMRFC